MSLFAIMVSIILHMAEVREMGLYDCGSSLPLRGLRIGIISASFQACGTSPLRHERFIRLTREAFEESGSCFSIS